MKLKSNQTRTYDGDGYKKRAACLCFRSESEEEVRDPRGARSRRPCLGCGGIFFLDAVERLSGSWCFSPFIFLRQTREKCPDLNAGGVVERAGGSALAQDGIWQLSGATTLAELQSSASHEVGEET